jgi:hypothetical protein
MNNNITMNSWVGIPATSLKGGVNHVSSLQDETISGNFTLKDR